MKQPKVGLCTSVRIFIELSKAIEAIELLSYHFTLTILRLILGHSEWYVAHVARSTTYQLV
jgi:hypothetical protein